MQPGLLRRLAALEARATSPVPIRGVFRIIALGDYEPDWLRALEEQAPVDNSGAEPVDNFSADLSTGMEPVDNFLRIELEPGDTLLDVALELRIAREELQRRIDAGSIELIYPTEKA